MLYLPSLKNVIADFLSRPTSPPELSGTITAVADPVDFEAIAAKKNRCAETLHLLGSSSLKLAFRQAGAQHLVGNVSTEVFRPLVQTKFCKDIFCICTEFPTLLGGRPLGALCLLVLSGAPSLTTSPAGQNSACTASRSRSTATSACYRSPSSFPSGGLLISTLTWWVLYNTVVVVTTFSRSLIAHPSGRKQSPFLKHPRRRVHVL
jgi:hypothetical protein